MGTRKGCKKFWNTETGEQRCTTESLTLPWIPGLSPEHRSKLIGHRGTAGMKVYFNPETGKHSKFYADPGSPWIRGHSPQARENLSNTRKRLKISPNAEVRERISKTLTGYRHGWRESVSKAVALRAKCNTFYLLKLKYGDYVFGKWGSTTSGSFQHREKEFLRRGIDFEILLMIEVGGSAPLIEAEIGRLLSKFPAANRPDFYGKTETFEWNEITESIVNDLIQKHSEAQTNGLEKDSPSKGY